jgi:hypothetical protein
MTVPSWLKRLACASVIGLLIGGYSDWFWDHPRPKPSDFTQLWAAARMLLQGENPYALIGHGRAFEHDFPLLYPVPAAIVAMPFAWATPRVADALFVGFGAALLAWSLTRRTFANPQLLVFPSYALMVAAQNAQWSPWLTAAALTPSLGFLFACKPSIGLAMLAAYPSRAAILGAGVFTLLTVAIWPWWIPAWLATLSAATHMSAPVMRWGGPFILLALLKWRRQDARLLAALACVPQTPVLYEVVPLFLLVQTFREGTLLIVLTALAGKIIAVTTWGVDYYTFMNASGQWMVWLVYLPCTVMVLRRPNEGLLFRVPEWMTGARVPDRA